MVGPEKKFWALLKKNLVGPHWVRVENTVMSGTPDVNGGFRGVERWIELKVATRNRLVKFQSAQVPWLFQRSLKGTLPVVLVLDDDLIKVFHPSLSKSSSVSAGEGWHYVSIFGVGPLLTLTYPYEWSKLLDFLFPLPNGGEK